MSGSYSPRLVECRRVLAIIGRAQGATEEAWTQVRAMLPAGTVGSETPALRIQEFAFAMQQLAVALALDARDFPTGHAWLEAHDRWLDWSGAVLGGAEGALLWAQYPPPTTPTVIRLRRVRWPSGRWKMPLPRVKPLALIAPHRFLGPASIRGSVTSITRKSICTSPLVWQRPVRRRLDARALTLLEIANLRMAREITIRRGHFTGRSALDLASPLKPRRRWRSG